MRLTCNSFEQDSSIPGDFAFCVPNSDSHVALGGNRNPALSWEDLPPATKSLVLICHDPDVPSKPDDVNQEGRTVPADLPRVDFYHWVLVDLDPAVSRIGEAEFSDGVVGQGKDGPASYADTRSGVNSYTDLFAGDAKMEGDYHGYDGPCPPWNDSILHHYIFTLYALDVDRCPAEGRFTGPDVLAAIEGHVLDQTSATGTYSLNPDVK